MAIPDVKESWPAQVVEVQIGATADEGGTRTSVVKVGGHKGLPFHWFEDAVGNPPVIAAHILDVTPEDWAPELAEAYKDVWGDVATWAKYCVDEVGVDMVALTLQGCHPDFGDRAADHAGCGLSG